MFIVFKLHIYAGTVTDQSYPRIKIMAREELLLTSKSIFWRIKVSWNEQTRSKEVLSSFEMWN